MKKSTGDTLMTLLLAAVAVVLAWLCIDSIYGAWCHSQHAQRHTDDRINHPTEQADAAPRTQHSVDTPAD